MNRALEHQRDGRRRCARCDELLPLAAFRPDARLQDGLSSYCRPCAVERTREWRRQHRNDLNTRKRKLYKARRGMILARRRELYAAKRFLRNEEL